MELEHQIEEYKQLTEKLESVNGKLAESDAMFKMISDYSSDFKICIPIK